MKLRTFRAATMQEALAMVRRELGEDAALLHTREVRGQLLRWLPGGRQIELTASQGVNVPSRLPHLATADEAVVPPPIPTGRVTERESPHTAKGDSPVFTDRGRATNLRSLPVPAIVGTAPDDSVHKAGQSTQGRLGKLRAKVDNLRRQSRRIAQDDRQEELLGLLAELLEATAVVIDELEEPAQCQARETVGQALRA